MMFEMSQNLKYVALVIHGQNHKFRAYRNSTSTYVLQDKTKMAPRKVLHFYPWFVGTVAVPRFDESTGDRWKTHPVGMGLDSTSLFIASLTAS